MAIYTIPTSGIYETSISGAWVTIDSPKDQSAEILELQERIEYLEFLLKEEENE